MASKSSYIVQIDNDGLERKNEVGQQRWKLNAEEIRLIERRHLAQKILQMMVEKSAKIPEIAEALDLDPYFLARVTWNHEATKTELVKQAVGLFLSLDPKPRSKFAEELGISHQMFKSIMEGDEFAITYQEYFSELTSDPTVKAVNSKLIEELLPKAYRQLDRILNDDNASASVRLKAALEIFRLSGIKERQVAHEDRQQLSEFLSKHQVNITQVNINSQDEVIDGEIVDAESPPPETDKQELLGYPE